MTVEVTIADGSLVEVTPLSEADIAKEKLGQLSDHGSKIASAIFNDVGKDVAIAYGVFAVAALFLNMIAGNGMMAAISFNLPDVLNGLSAFNRMGVGQGGAGALLVFLSACSIAVPYFWKHKYAPLALCAPMLVTLYADYQIYHVYALAKAQIAQAQGMMGNNPFAAQMVEKMNVAASPFSLGLGAYVTIAVGAYLAFRGVMRISLYTSPQLLKLA